MLARRIAFALLALGCAPALAGAEVRIALLPIAVHAKGDDVDYLSAGLAEMLAARIEQYDGLRVVRPGGESVAIEDAAAASKAGGEAGAAYALYGSFTQFGEGASLDLRCVAAPGGAEAPEAKRVFIQSGSVAEIIPKLDTLAEKIARYALGQGGPAPRIAGEAGAAAPAGNGATAGNGAALSELQQRVDALERAVFTPLAKGEPPASAPQGAAAGSAGEVVR